jgi:hypothetical protein
MKQQRTIMSQTFAESPDRRNKFCHFYKVFKVYKPFEVYIFTNQKIKTIQSLAIAEKKVFKIVETYQN